MSCKRIFVICEPKNKVLGQNTFKFWIPEHYKFTILHNIMRDRIETFGSLIFYVKNHIGKMKIPNQSWSIKEIFTIYRKTRQINNVDTEYLHVWYDVESIFG